MTEPANLEPTAPAYRLTELVRYFLYLGAAGFGGPVALVEYMHRDLVERRGWITEDEYREGLALANLSPGPLAAQLAIYLGFVHYRFLGASLVAVAFVLPSFLIVIAVGWAYLRFGGLAMDAGRLLRRRSGDHRDHCLERLPAHPQDHGRDPLLWIIFGRNGRRHRHHRNRTDRTIPTRRPSRLGGTEPTPPEEPRIHCRCAPPIPVRPGSRRRGARPRAWARSSGSSSRPEPFVFGSGLAIVPFLYGGVVNGYGWLDAQQFLDAVAVAMITPGPVVITTAFIGYLVAGLPGAIVAAIATFLPAYLLTVFPAPYFRKYGSRPALSAIVDGVTAAAIGAITGAVIVLGRRAIIDLPTALLAIAALLILWKSPRRIPEPILVAGAAVAGLVLHPIISG